jgi:hypothetical protein
VISGARVGYHPAGATLVSTAVDTLSCIRCNAPAIEAYLQTLL